MLRFIIRRLALLVVIAIGITFVTFSISHVIPADPAALIAGHNATPETLALIRHQYGLDKSLGMQYVDYLKGIVHGNLGTSTYSRRAVTTDLRTYLPATFELVLFAIVAAVLIGVPLGVLSAIRKAGFIDHASRLFSIAGSALPLFWLGLLLQLLFGGIFHLLPISGRLSPSVAPPPNVTGMFTIDSLLAGQLGTFEDALKHIVLPAAVLAFASLSLMVRVTRASMLEVLSQDYIRTARTKGLSRHRVITRHALRNALIAPVTLLGLQLGYLLSGVFLVEVVFSWPGIGFYSVHAVQGSDYVAIMGVTLVVALIYSTINLLTDIAYLAMDPRISYET
jgi:ABC-type dipeptide/oligopeptide/nickel transport system permease component